MSAPKKEKKEYYIPLGVLAVVILLTVLVVIPMVSKISKTRDEILFNSKEIEEFYYSGRSLKGTNAQLKLVNDQLDILNNATLSAGQELHYITTLEGIAERNSLKQRIIMDELPEDIDSITKLPTRVELTGLFPDVVRYMRDIERLDFYVNWYQVSISALKVKNRQNILPRQAPDEAVVESTNQEVRAVLEGESFWKP